MSEYRQGCIPHQNIFLCCNSRQDEIRDRLLRKGRKTEKDPHRSTRSCDPRKAWQYNSNSEHKLCLPNHQLQTWTNFRNDKFHCQEDDGFRLEVFLGNGGVLTFVRKA